MQFHASQKEGLNHLGLYQNYVHGPIQRDEAVFLYALCKMIRPRVIVEFGLQSGLSALNFNLAKDDECHYYGYDISEVCVEETKNLCQEFKNCNIEEVNCVDFNSTMIAGKKIDLCFLDCSHNLAANQKCLQKVVPLLSSFGLLAIHDTGLYTPQAIEKAPDWYKENCPKRLKNLQKSIPVIAAERHTVNWLLNQYTHLHAVNFHAETIMRSGITLLQQFQPL
jgi:predicted O-methyltransferase YrrM